MELGCLLGKNHAFRIVLYMWRLQNWSHQIQKHYLKHWSTLALAMIFVSALPSSLQSPKNPKILFSSLIKLCMIYSDMDDGCPGWFIVISGTSSGGFSPEGPTPTGISLGGAGTTWLSFGCGGEGEVFELPDPDNRDFEIETCRKEPGLLPLLFNLRKGRMYRRWYSNYRRDILIKRDFFFFIILL